MNNLVLRIHEREHYIEKIYNLINLLHLFMYNPSPLCCFNKKSKSISISICNVKIKVLASRFKWFASKQQRKRKIEGTFNESKSFS